MIIGHTRIDISGISTEQQQYDFEQAGANVISGIYARSPRKWKRFHFWTLLLHIKGLTAFAEICRVNDVQCHLLADYTKWVRKIADAFRSIFVPLTLVFAKLVANSESSIPQDLWNDHLSTFTTSICIPFTRAFRNQELSLKYGPHSTFCIWSPRTWNALGSSTSGYRAWTASILRKPSWWSTYFNFFLKYRAAICI